jgi:hypothetical protein
MDHCHRQLAAFDHDLCTRAYPRQQASEVAGGFRFRDVDHIVSHRAIIQSFFLVRFSFQSGQQFAPVLLGRSSGSTSRKETNGRAHCGRTRTAVRRLRRTRSLNLHIAFHANEMNRKPLLLKATECGPQGVKRITPEYSGEWKRCTIIVRL